MPWSHKEYKEDELQVFTTLSRIAGQPLESRFQINNAIDIICQGDIIVPQSVREALRRVICARQRATAFFTRIKSADAGHEVRLQLLNNILQRLEQHAMVVKARMTRNVLQEDDLLNGRIAVQSDSDTILPLSNNTSQVNRTDITLIDYERSKKEIAVANFVSDLVNIHDWINIQWTRAARGRDDLATIAYSSYAARELARQVLHIVGLEIGWQDPLFLEYATKVGLLSNENEYVSTGAHSTFVIVLRKQNKIRWHVYSNVGESMHAPNFDQSCGSDTPAQLERWLFCAAISGWDADPELTAILDRCLLVALNTQMHSLLQNIPATGFRHMGRLSALDGSIEKVMSFSTLLRSLKFSPDPWTLSFVIAQTTSLIHYQEIALSTGRLYAAVYGEKYQAIANGSLETTLQKDFGCLLPTGSLNTIDELHRAWKIQQRHPAKIGEKIDSLQWTWKVFRDEHIPIMFSKLNTSRNYVSMLDKIRDQMSVINSRRLNIKALPLPSDTRGGFALRDIAKFQLNGSLYIPGKTIRILGSSHEIQISPGIAAETNLGAYSEAEGVFTVNAGSHKSTRTLGIYIGKTSPAAFKQQLELTCAHGIGDLIMHPTEEQRRSALEESGYGLRDAEGRIATALHVVHVNLPTVANEIHNWVAALPATEISATFEISS